MMTKKMKRGLLFVALGACVVATATLGASAMTRADETFETASPLKPEYTVGEIVTLPRGSFNVGGKTLPATTYVISPDGVKKRGNEATLAVAGNYTLVYEAIADGKTYTEEKTFSVYAPKYSVDNSVATFQCATREFLRETYVYDSETQKGVYTKEGTETGEGMYLTLVEGATFTYNKVFDLSGYTANDCVFKCNVLGGESGGAPFYQLTLRLTDVYDVNNYIEFVLWKNGTAATYMRAGSCGQPTAGLSGTSVSKTHGTWTRVSFNNNASGTAQPVNGLCRSIEDAWDVGFDYETKKVYTTPIGISDDFVCELDDTKFFQTPWSGFTTGECLVSISATDFNDATGTIFIQSLMGETATDFKDNKLLDTNAPVITMDLGAYTEETLPFAVVGQEYAVFDVHATDFLSGCEPVVARVYYENKTTQRTNVTLQNGKFIPKAEGNYTIVYTVRDYFGNESSTSVVVPCIKATDKPFSITLDETGDRRVYVGTDGKIDGVTVKNASGETIVKITAEKDGKTWAIDENTLMFRPETTGKYTIRYSVSDYVGQTSEKTYEVEVYYDGNPVYNEEIVLPKYLLAGEKHVLPTLDAWDYANGKVTRVQSVVSVKEGENAVRTLNGTEYVPATVADGTFVEITYTATTATGKATKTYKVPCYNTFSEPGVYDKSKLFIASEGVTRAYEKTTNSATLYATYAFIKDGVLSFVNALPADKFSVQYRIVNGDFTALHFYLTDTVDPTQRIQGTFHKAQTGVQFSVNGGSRYDLSVFDFANPNKTIDIGFNNVTVQFETDNGNSAYAVTETVDGKPFAGFTSGAVYFEIVVEGVNTEGTTKLAIQKICNQTITDSASDGADPELAIITDYRDEYELGDTVTLRKSTAKDVIKPYTYIYITVYDVQNKPTTAEDGTLLDKVAVDRDYTIKFSDYGSYKVKYFYGEDKDALLEYEFLFNVVDRTLPTVELKNLKTEYKVGDTITLSATATDNVTMTTDVAITVEDCNGVIMTYKQGTSYKFTKAGRYVVQAYVYDDNGNYNATSVVITVS